MFYLKDQKLLNNYGCIIFGVGEVILSETEITHQHFFSGKYKIDIYAMD